MKSSNKNHTSKRWEAIEARIVKLETALGLRNDAKNPKVGDA